MLEQLADYLLKKHRRSIPETKEDYAVIRKEIAILFRTLDIVCDGSINTSEHRAQNIYWIMIDGRTFSYTQSYTFGPHLREYTDDELQDLRADSATMHLLPPSQGVDGS